MQDIITLAEFGILLRRIVGICTPHRLIILQIITILHHLLIAILGRNELKAKRIASIVDAQRGYHPIESGAHQERIAIGIDTIDDHLGGFHLLGRVLKIDIKETILRRDDEMMIRDEI